MAKRWRIYYADGSLFTFSDGTPFDAPGRGVEVIAQEHADAGREYLCKTDFYWWTGERWIGGDLFGVWDYLVDPGPRKILIGRMIGSDVFNRIMLQATSDDLLPAKSAYVGDEVRLCQ